MLPCVVDACESVCYFISKHPMCSIYIHTFIFFTPVSGTLRGHRFVVLRMWLRVLICCKHQITASVGETKNSRRNNTSKPIARPYHRPIHRTHGRLVRMHQRLLSKTRTALRSPWRRSRGRRMWWCTFTPRMQRCARNVATYEVLGATHDVVL